jgi:hypothetical protein
MCENPCEDEYIWSRTWNILGDARSQYLYWDLIISLNIRIHTLQYIIISHTMVNYILSIHELDLRTVTSPCPGSHDPVVLKINQWVPLPRNAVFLHIRIVFPKEVVSDIPSEKLFYEYWKSLVVRPVMRHLTFSKWQWRLKGLWEYK